MTKKKITSRFNLFIIFYSIGLGLILLTIVMSQVFGPRYSEDIYDSTASTVAIDEYEYQYNEIDYDAYETSSMPFGIGYILGVGMGVALLITGFIFFYVAHYNYWKLVQRPDVTTTPGKAVV